MTEVALRPQAFEGLPAVVSVGEPGAAGGLQTKTLADYYYELLALAPGELERELREMAEAEQALPERMRHSAARARLLAWLELSREERRILARSFERVMEGLPEDVQAARLEAERGAVLNGMSFDQFRELALALDWASREEMVAAA